MRGSVVLGLLVFASAGCAQSERVAKVPSPAEPVDTVGAEVAVASGPDGSIFAAWIGPKGIEVARTLDGASFDEAVTVSVAGWRGCDPAIAVARDGTIELAFLGVGAHGEEAFFTEGALESLPAHVARIVEHAPGADLDKTSIAVVSDGTTLVSYVEAGDGDDAVMVARRGADGKFTETRVSDAHDVAVPALCAAPDSGRAWITYVSGVRAQIVARATDDGGRTWSGASVALEVGPSMDDPFVLAALTTPPSCVAAGREVWVLSGARHIRSELMPAIVAADDIYAADMLYLSHAKDDDGFDGPRCVGGAHDGHRFLDPALAREADGSIDVVYYSGDHDDDDSGALRWARWTSDGLSASQPIAPVRFHSRRDDDEWLGDYLGAAIVDGALVVAYADNRSGHSHVGLRRVTLPKR